MGDARLELLVRLLSEYQEEPSATSSRWCPTRKMPGTSSRRRAWPSDRKFGEYDPSKPFLAWAFGFAYREALKQRDRNARDPAT